MKVENVKNIRGSVVVEWLLKRKCIISFLLGSISFYMFLSYSEMAGGRYSPIFSDAMEIYIPAIRQFCRDILSGQSINYSWTNSFGMDTIAYNAYNVYSITNILYLIFFNCDVQIITCISLSIKAGLAAMFFEYYAEKVWKVESNFGVIISLCYALSAYQISYNLVNFIWMDAFFMLPLILYLLHILHRGKASKWLVVSLAYLFVTNFYMAYIVGIFCFLYFCIIVIPEIEGMANKLKNFLTFGVATILAAAIDAAILIPTALTVVGNRAEDANSILKLDMPMGTIVNQMFFGEGQSLLYNTFPNVYCSIFVLMLFPAFFILYKDNMKMVLRWGGLILFMVVSCYVPALDIMWHAFDAPDGWGWRFSFLISFIMCVLACLVTNKISNLKIKYFALWGAVLGVFYIGYGIVLLGNPQYRNTNTVFLGLINLMLYFMYALFLLLRDRKDDKKFKTEILTFIGVMVVIELVTNGCIVMHRYASDGVLDNSDKYSSWIENQEQVISQISDDDFYRIRFVGSMINNADTMLGVSGTSDFFTIENFNLRNTLSMLGVATSTRMVEDFGYTPFTDMILGNKYKIYCGLYDENEKKYGSSSFVVNDKALGLGYLVDEDIVNYQLEYKSAFDNINNLASSMMGHPLEIFETYSGDDIMAYENGIHYLYDGQHILEADSNVSGTKLLSLSIPDNGKEAYVQFGIEEAGAYIKSPVLLNGEENWNNIKGLLSILYIKKMDATELGNTVTILMDDNTYSKAYIDGIYFAYLNEECLVDFYEKLNDNQLAVNEFKDGYVSGNVSMKEGMMLFTSIPYEEGWRVTANGEKVEIVPVINDTFIGVKLPEGEYELEFKYENPYMKIGSLVSVIGLMILVGLFCCEKIVNKKFYNII